MDRSTTASLNALLNALQLKQGNDLNMQPFPKSEILASYLSAVLGKVPEYDIRTITGTGALITVADCGFSPKAVVVVNVTTLSAHIFLSTMAADHTFELIGGAGAFVWNAANGINLIAGGYTLGTLADLNTVANELHVLAIG